MRRRLARAYAVHPAALLVLLLLPSCHSEEREPPLFRLLSPEESGVTFANVIRTDDSVNVQSDPYLYNGAGVAAGDIDNDGLVDLFFAGNQVSSRLYRNLGGMRFEDITERAGVSTDRWAGGVAMIDINADGRLDIYVAVTGHPWSEPAERTNLLFVNDGDGTFTERAAEYGIDHKGFTIHSVFFDYDRDGCVDLFLLTNSPQDFSRAEAARHPAGVPTDAPDSQNQLLRNTCSGRFVNVSQDAGIVRSVGHGLGAVAGDLNRDGWPDLYVSNDITPNDVLYVNNGDGTFTDRAGNWIRHASYAGMGIDIADFDNDGWPDIVQVDMLPRDLAIRKRMSGIVTYAGLTDTRRRGFRDDYPMNALQWSSGVAPSGDVIFSEIARLAGVEATDWSWAPLFADFDNDGRRDLFITTGYPKAVNDFDYRGKIDRARRKRDPAEIRKAELAILDSLHGYQTGSRIYRNNGDLTFTDRTAEWGIAAPAYSIGAAYADLNDDGWLDLVVNNIDGPAFIYENTGGRRQPDAEANRHLTIRLEGEGANGSGLGASLRIVAGGVAQHVYATPYRGYMSTVDDRVHLGLGAVPRVDTLEVIWPDGRFQRLTGVGSDTLLVLRQHEAAKAVTGDNWLDPSAEAGRVFTPSGGRSVPPYRHEVGWQVDYAVQPLLPYMPSRLGPAIAAGDVNGDGLDDLFVGGGVGVAGQLFIQQQDGGWRSSGSEAAFAADRAYEDWGATFLDANGDGRLDLYVASGGYQLTPSSPLLQDRLYINRGGARFIRDPQALPEMIGSTAVVRAGDFTGDGKPDLFIGGRLTPRSWPSPARSWLLRNDGGRFTDVTAEVAPELAQPHGMVTAAAWVDVDGDSRLDLVTAGEWMPVVFHRNDGSRLRDVTEAMKLPPLRGWWFSLAAGDIDGDGDQDLVAGNLGLNHTYESSAENPFGVYAADFTGNQTTGIVLTTRIGGTEYPLQGLVPLGRQIYSLAVRHPTYAGFGAASMRELFSPAQLESALHHEADTFASMLLLNGGGSFTALPLPNPAQISPVRGIVIHDVDGDGHQDLIVAGNLHETEPNTPRADAGIGLWLRGDGEGRFTPVHPAQSGLLAPRDVSSITLLRTPAGQSLLIANTADSLQAFAIRRR